MSDTAIRVTNVTKEYTIDYSHTGSFKELVMRKLFHGRQNHIESRKNILALDNLSFEVKKGEALGIIGKNGAGKSTLLKVLSGITRPTSGKIEIYGRMSSILDIGVGFHPELTGRENIFLSGELNGLNRKEIRKRMDEIIDFSGVEKFIDTPVKYYSSGMFLRLAFSVFTGIDSDILLLDEVMSVGDAEFQLKSSRKLQTMFGQGKTIVLVSHNPADIVKLCSRVMILEGGKIREEGIPGKVVVDYMEESIIEAMEASIVKSEIEETGSVVKTEFNPEMQQPKIRNYLHWDDPNTAPGNEFFKLREIQVRNETRAVEDKIYVDEKIVVELYFDKQDKLESINIALRFSDINGNPLFVASPSLTGDEKELKDFLTQPGQKSLKCIIQDHLFSRSIFLLDIYVSNSMKNRLLFSLPYILSFTTYFKQVDSNLELYSKDNHPILPVIIWQAKN